MRADLNGVSLHWEETGSGEPLLWLHGFLGSGVDWRTVFPEPPAGYRLVAPDLRGHGGSTAPPGPYSFRESAVDALALLDRLGLERANLVGLSGGGITALHMATIAPSRVSAMVVVSAPPSFPEQARSIQRTFTEAMLPAAELVRMRDCHRRPGQIEALLAQARALADASDPNFTPADLAAVTARTLIVFGDRDPFYPVSMAFDLYRAIPRARLWVVPNGGHGPIFGPAAPGFVRTTLEFLGSDWFA
jgi:pimeloyl-ACP methyl ester carboxylesterase